MTIEERNIKLKHYITCMKCEVSGKVCDENCPTQYEAGNMGEIIENLEEISKILEQQSCEDAISRSEALSVFRPRGITENVWKECDVYKKLTALPSVTSKEKTEHWIQQSRYDGDDQPDLVCPNCGFKISWWDMGNFCAKCGTGLEGGADG